MIANDDGSSSPCKRRRNATNVTDYFQEDKGRKYCTYPNCIKSYSLKTSTSGLMYHLRSEQEIFLIDKEYALNYEEVTATNP